MAKGFIAVAIALTALLSLNVLKPDSTTTHCDGVTTELNTSLPSSHPLNRCALVAKPVSWMQWIMGNSRSMQFHFIDLLELMTKVSPPADNKDIKPSPRT
ncbi:MAG: hypothetical protein ACRCT7_05230 [Shewanella sp.]|uniref:hypothetical protein n=1 Tax=Shewanella sp. SNU WT4 TaxID=2590015 RepID=UPI00112B146B|nr:hypothetical protein [Shewanella sp. SNU WT4]QDF65808.1 hypothetical protein FJQ87_03160 [Shewanella sp. SNU WT4]